MRYIVTDAGIKFIDDAIPDVEAVESVKHIAAHVNDYQCDCAACREKRRNAIGISSAAATADNEMPVAVASN